jgi:hypothetical protein
LFKENSSAPPIILRQQPPRPETPEPLIIREIPPIPPPSNIGPKIITISGKKLPPSRKVVVERLPPLPLKPKSIIIEKWLPYPEVKRKVIYNKTNQPEIKKPKNIIINWETPETEIKTEIRYLGIVKVDPKEYSEKYKDTLKDPNNLPSIVNQVPTPIGLILASDLRNKNENKNNKNRNELILSSIESSSSPKSKFKNLNDTFELSEKRKSTPIEKRKKNDVSFSLSSNLGSIIGKDRVLSFIKENNNSIDFDNLSSFSTVPSTIESGRNQNKDKSCSSTDQQKISTNYSKKKK